MISSDILNAAADLLEQKDWLQGYLARDQDGNHAQPAAATACQFCLLGAIFHFTDQNETGRPKNPNGPLALRAVSRVLGAPPDTGLISAYNDVAGRTKEEVIATLREAARQEREAGR